jgi:hypothetical protein
VPLDNGENRAGKQQDDEKWLLIHFSGVPSQ